MFQNNNRAVIKKISHRSLKTNRTKNIFVLLAIILTTVLFTTVFTLGGSLYKGMKEEKFRQSGTTAHGMILGMNELQIEMLKKNPLVKKVGVFQRLSGRLDNSKLGDAIIGLAYLDDAALSMKVYDNFKGKWPVKEEEIALPTWVLDQLNLPHKIGQKINFHYVPSDTFNMEEEKSTDFILSAYYTEYTQLGTGGRGVAIASKALKEKVKTKLDGFIFLKEDTNLSEDFKRIAAESGIYNNEGIKINPAYINESELKWISILPYAGMILLIIACGYLLIYNIFHIAIIKDIRFLGLLKTIGTTPRQIRRIITNQALLLCSMGIPIGIGIGYFISFILVPLVLQNTNVSKVEISFHPLIFLGTIFFTFITVVGACRKPAKIASKVSPIEATKYVTVEEGKRRKIKRTRKGAKIYKMALSNVFRHRKRAIVVLLSLSLGVTCFLCASAVSRSMDVTAYMERYVTHDFKINNVPLKTGVAPQKEVGDYLDEALYRKIGKIKEVKGVERVQVITTALPYAGLLKENAKAMHKRIPNYKEGFEEKLPENYKIETNFLGVTPNILDYIKKEEIVAGEIDKVKFQSGKYAVLSLVYDESIKVGDAIDIGTEEQPITVEVMAIIKNGAAWYYSRYNDGPNIYLDENAVRNIYPNCKTISILFDVKKGQDVLVHEKIKEIIGDSSNISVEAKYVQKQFFIQANKAFYILLGGISIVIALIGALNFINTMLTSINTRKGELAIFQSVGMTRKQMKQMLTLEGVYYGLFTMMIVGSFGSIMAYYAVKAFKTQADYAVYFFSTIPLTGATVMILLLSIIIPQIVFKLMLKESVVDRLRDF